MAAKKPQKCKITKQQESNVNRLLSTAMSGYANSATKLHYALNSSQHPQREIIANELIFPLPVRGVDLFLKAKSALRKAHGSHTNSRGFGQRVG